MFEMKTMKATKATVKTVIAKLGMSLDDFRLMSSRGIVEIETNLSDKQKGNRMVSKVVKKLVMSGIKFYAFKTGYDAWIYRLNDGYNYSRELASQNID